MTTFDSTALLLIDIQYDFLEGGALAVPDASEIFGPIEAIRNRFSKVVATQDWHPAGHASFASSHPGKAPFQEHLWKGKMEMLWPDHCVQGSHGAELHPKVQEWKPDVIIRKGMDPGTDSYSGFFDNHRQHNTGLEEWLKRHKIKSLWVAGLATDYCVKNTVLDAIRQGFEVTVLEDGIRAVSKDTGRVAIEDMKKAGAQLV